ncbi:Sodium channel protein Nach [Anthophora retusa]
MSKRFPKKDRKLSRPPIDRINVKSIVDFPKDENNTPEKNKQTPTPRDVFNNYLESTSVHGLQYFGKIDIKVGTAGKILWTCTILICFICLSLMVVQFLQRYNQNPTNTYIKTFEAPIYKIPFPAVTVCPVAPISMKKRLAILENAFLPKNVSREFLLNLLKYGHHIMNPYTEKNVEYFGKLETFLEANKWKIPDFLKILTPCEEMFESCWWSAERINCVKSMKTARSAYGLCCSFNYYLEEGHPKPKLLSSASFGRWSGLKLVISNEMLTNEDNTNDFMRITYNNNIMILIHHSMDFPGFTSNTYIVRADDELEIAVKPTAILKPEGLYHRNKDNQLTPVCIADKANPLEYMPVYRHENCYTNCKAKMMYKFCGCLPFIFDPIAEFYNIPHCKLDGLQCIQQKLGQITAAKDIKNKNVTCSCGNPCFDVLYDGLPNTISMMKANFSKTRTEGTAIVRVYMYSQVYQILETLPAADMTYLLASIGGIFSLFLGCSFLSLVEIVYFLYLFCRAVYLHGRTESRTREISDGSFTHRRRHVY